MKKFLLLLISVMLCLALVGCADDVDAPVDTTGGESALEGNDSTTSEELQMVTDSGTYVGQIDSNFIEIEISGIPEENAAKSFMLSPELKGDFEALGLGSGDNVKFDYYVNENSQNVITGITVLASYQPPAENTGDSAPDYIVPEDADEIVTDSGTYVGQMDSNFIEINISGVPEAQAAKAFMLSPELKAGFEDLGLNTGDAVKFDYYVNADNQNVILSIDTDW